MRSHQNSRFSVFLEGQSVQAGQIRTLVRGIAYALEHMEQYLLSENCVLLTPEYFMSSRKA